jgi:hypothetical protein
VNLTVADLKAMAAPRIIELCAELAPGGKVSGSYWLTRSPLRADKHAGSFYVWIKGPATGAWKDAAAGLQGDLVDLIASSKYGTIDRQTRGDAIQWLKRFLGIADVAPAELSQARVKARLEAKARDEREAREKAIRDRRAFDLWLSGKPLSGTLGESYLAARGIFPRLIPNLSTTFRFLGAVDYWKAGPSFRGPAIIGGYRCDLGIIRAVHGTWLNADGTGKADLSPAKLSLGAYKGRFLPISKGASGKEVWDAGCPPGPVVITEGPEDGWSVAQASPDLRVWAAGSLSNIGNMPRPAGVSAFLVVRQNDWDTPAAVAAFDRAIEQLARHGAPVSVISCGFGKDPNDQLRGVA